MDEAAPGPRRSLAVRLVAIGAGIVLVLAATGAGYLALYRVFYSPSAFVASYLSLLSQGRAADAMRVPGVGVDSATLKAAGLAASPSEAMLRRAALGSLTDVHVVGERTEGEETVVTVTYVAGGHNGTSEFRVEPDGWLGLAPSWRFAQTPLAVVDLTVEGSADFSVNGFAVDKRQIAARGVDADLAAPVPLLVFTPGLYSVSVSNQTATSGGVAVLADAPLTTVDVDVKSDPTPAFLETVQNRVDEFLAKCAKEEVLQPAGCPFGLRVENRVAPDATPAWSVVTSPKVTVRAHGAGWVIPSAQGLAHVKVEMQSIYDGTLSMRDEDVAFVVSGEITMQPDGSASISISSPDMH